LIESVAWQAGDLLGKRKELAEQVNNLLGKELAEQVNDLLGKELAEQVNDLLGEELAEQVNDLLANSRQACYELSGSLTCLQRAGHLTCSQRAGCNNLVVSEISPDG
jgi:hypothetical protein